MLTHLDHIVLLRKEMGTALSDYTALLGAEPVFHIYENMFQTAYFQTGNVGLEIIAPDGPHAYDYIRDILGDAPSALTSLAFSADNIAQARHKLERRGLAPTDISESRNDRQKFRCPDSHCAGIKTFILSQPESAPRAAIHNNLRLDHLVINTPNPDRAIAHYGARLGLRFALDRTEEKWGARFMFFKIGDVVLEVIHRLGQNHDPSGDDHIWGLTWKVDDLEAAHKRLASKGVKTSEIRTGRKPGTRVFTVKSHTAGVPTLILEQA